MTSSLPQAAASFATCPQQLGLYAVVPDAAWVKRLVALNVPTLQLRNKTLAGEALRAEIQQAVAAVQGTETRLFINDYWQLALEAGAYGVHLGQEDLDALAPADLEALRQAGLRLGISTHGVAELDRALALRPSYVAMGAVYATTTKVLATAPQGLEKLAAYVQQVKASPYSVPSVAIGGIFAHNAADVFATGVDNIAVVRAVTEADDVAAAVRELTRCIEAARGA